ncbi:MAG: SPASM domain-containing protein [Acidimicrobiales bacterium]
MLRGRLLRRSPRPQPLTRPARTSKPPAPRFGCLAASVQMYLTPDGLVRVCCRNWQPLGNVMETSLLDLWRGAGHRDLVARIARDDYSAGCEQCHAETVVEGRTRAYPANFDDFTDAVEAFGDEAGLVWPSRIEFNLSNSCNLMCIQCNGLLSSSIRAHREHLPALPEAYGDQFFTDLEQFIPHLTEAQFAGGEPFLAKESFRVWDLIAELNPDLPVIVVTNATQWSRRIDEVTDRLRMGFTFSIDAINKATYEAIRINARHEVTMANVERYIAKSRACDMPLEVNFCLMPQNHRELPEMLLWAEERGMKVNVSIVRNPVECCLAARSTDELAEVLEHWESWDDRVRPHLGEWNLPVWDDELERIRTWRDAEGEVRRGLYWETLIPIPTVPTRNELGVVPTVSARNELGVVAGVPFTEDDRAAAQAWVEGLAPGVEVHTIDVDDVADDDGEVTAVVIGISTGAAAALGLDADAVVGGPVHLLLDHLQGTFGQVEDLSADEREDGRTDTEMRFERAQVRASAIPRPDAAGATILVAVEPR